LDHFLLFKRSECLKNRPDLFALRRGPMVVYNRVKNKQILLISIIIWEQINRLTIITIAKAPFNPITPIKKCRGSIKIPRGR
jgi:hypothetical protein